MSALVCLTYDDALPVHCEVVAPLLAERGLRGTFYIPAARDDFHHHLEDWRKVAAMGHELGNHSCFHPCRTRAEWDWKPPYRLEEYTRAQLEAGINLADDFQRTPFSNTFHRIDDLVFKKQTVESAITWRETEAQWTEAGLGAYEAERVRLLDQIKREFVTVTHIIRIEAVE